MRVRYIWKQAVYGPCLYINGDYVWGQYGHLVLTNGDSAWSDWVPYRARPEDRRVTFPNQQEFNRSCPAGSQKIGYIFAIQAQDTAGAVTPYLTYGVNVINVKITSVAGGAEAVTKGMQELGIEGLRHIVALSVALSYSPEFEGLTYVDSAGVRRSRFNSFSGIGISGLERSYLTFGLSQRLQAKVKRGGNVTRLDNLLSWTMAGSYDFLYREHGAAHPLSNISSALLVQPPRYMSANLGWTTDLYSPKPIRTVNYNLGLNLDSGGLRGTTPDLPAESRLEGATGENWSLGLAYSYAGGYAGGTDWSSTRTGNVVGRYQLTPSWALEYSASLNVSRRQVQSQRFVLTRDLHCWQATFTRSFVVGGETEYYFRIGVKDQKEIYMERGTRMGSLGGIN